MREHKGFDNPSIAYINLIRDNLRDRYTTGFPIVKELVQNADDAGANCLDFGWTRGLGTQVHRLLQGPGLFVVNNGPFTGRDADAIHQLGLSDRAGEKATIGKFGLGLKSVFHLCEAFFYLSSPHAGEEWRSRYPRADVLNPWASGSDEEPIHDAWNRFTEHDQRAILNHVDRFLQDDTWFIIWLPLRQRAHLEGIAPIIEGEFPGDSDRYPEALLSRDIAVRLATVLPMLRALTTIRAWVPGDAKAPFANLFSVGLEAGFQRRRFSGTDATPGSWPLEGTVQVRVPSTRPTRHEFRCRYAGRERILADPEFEALRRDAAWPHLSTYDHQGKPLSVAEKAVPHCAVYFSEGTADDPGLHITRSVFLPVGSAEDPYVVAGMSGVWLTLHCYGFVDAGRQEIKGDPPDSIAARWNRAMQTLGTYPLTLPALSQFVETTSLSERRVRALTQALQDAPLFRDHRTAICVREQWVCRLVAKDGPWAWRLVPMSQPVLTIPETPTADPGRWRQVFPGLVGLCEEAVITQSTWPRLTYDDSPAAWPPALLARVLASVSVEALLNPVHLDYFLTFLETCAGTGSVGPVVVHHLLRLTANVLARIPHDHWSKQTALLRRLVKLVPPSQRRALKPENLEGNEVPLWRSVLQRFMTLDLAVLLMPEELEPVDSPGIGVLNLADAGHLLRLLAEPPVAWKEALWREDESSWRSVAAAFAVAMLQGTGDGFPHAVSRFRELPFFYGQDCATNTQVPLTIQDLDQLLNARVLFTYAPRPRTAGLAFALQQALLDRHVILIKNQIARCLYTETAVSSCDAQGCLRLLAARPNLARAEARAQLLQYLRDQVTAHEGRTELRYLLHGEAAHYSRDQIDLLAPSGDAQQPWATLTRRALVGSGEGWRVLAPTLAELLDRKQCALLGIKPISAETAAAVLADCDLESIDWVFLTEAERQMVLHDLDVSLVARMRIHEDIHGQLCCALPDCYLEEDFPLDAPLFAGLTILRRSRDRRIALRQREFARPLTALEVVYLAMRQLRPVVHWPVVMDAVHRILPQPLPSALRTAAWLPTHSGEGVPPEDVIWLPRLVEEVGRIVPDCGGIYVDISSLDDALRAHPAFEPGVLSRLVPKQEEALTLLGEIMSDQERYRMGDLPPDAVHLPIFLDTFSDAPAELMPACTLLAALCRTAQADLARTSLLPRLLRDLSPSRLIQILRFLARKQERAPADRQQALLTLFNGYLARLAAAPNARTLLTQVRLPSQRGTWKAAAELCFDDAADNVDADDLVDCTVAGVLRARGVEAADVPVTGHAAGCMETAGAVAASARSSAELLRVYFAPWCHHVQEQLIGGFLCLLGDDPSILELAEQHLSGRHLDATRELFEWTPISAEVNGRRVVGWGEDIHTMMAKQRVTVEVDDNPGGLLVVPNLVGGTFQARKRAELSHLLVGSRSITMRSTDAFRHSLLRLQAIDPERFTPGELAELLRTTAAQVLSKWYAQNCSNLAEVWERLGETTQLSVEVAQTTLLDSAHFYLRQLRLSRDQPLGKLLLEWDAALTRKAEEQQVTLPVGQHRESRADADLLRIRAEVLRLLEFDPETQLRVLTSLRALMEGHYQYTPASIPFEVFQNADDAAIELAWLNAAGEAPRERSSHFVVSWDTMHLRFLHWGRAINQFRSGTRDGRDRGFERDLFKMLVLSASDKGFADDVGAVTGKFGLGFKSVFFATDLPHVLSARLGFAVVAGLLPHPLTDAARGHLEQLRAELSGAHSRDGTIVELPLRRGQIRPDAIVDRFISVAHLMVVFARAIKTCELRCPDGPGVLVSWNPHRLSGVPDTHVGQLHPYATSENGDPAPYALTLGSADGTVLLLLGPRGFQPLPVEIPTLWVTAPTQEYAGLGLAMNSPAFDLDVGRAQLARRTAANDERARALGKALGGTLCALYAAAVADWSTLREELALASDMTASELWDSLWEVFAVPLAERLTQGEPNEIVRLVSLVLAGDARHGFGTLFMRQPVIPTGLPGAYRAHIRLSDLRARTVGCLEDTRTFSAICDWPALVDCADAGTVISGGTWAVLHTLFPDLSEPAPIALVAVLERELGPRRRVSPPVAQRMGRLITREFLLGLERGTATMHDEHGRIQNLLAEVCFLAEDGSYVPGRALLLSQDETAETKDEWGRAGFAPAGRVLSRQYAGAAHEFFKACRKLEAGVEELSRWALVAQEEDTRRAFLMYLLNGELGARLAAQVVCEDLRGTWIEGLATDPVLEQFSVQDRRRLLASLYLEVLEPPPAIGSFTVLAPTQPSLGDVPRILKSIQQWWTGERQALVRTYESKVYPGNKPPALRRPFDPQDPACRSAWVTLFLLASTATMGRLLPEQHRGFVEFCRRKGWFEVFAAPCNPSEPPDPAPWMKVLDEFLQDNGDHLIYYQHMRQFVSIYAGARWLEEYVHAFLAIDQLPSASFTLDQITRPSTFALFQGGGPDGPPFSQALGIGACFVVRELVRLGVLHGEQAYPHCYVPVARVRSLFEEYFGVPIAQGASGSTDIHKFLCRYLSPQDVTFDKGFDLPFLAIADDERLKERFFSGRRARVVDDFTPYDDEELA